MALGASWLTVWTVPLGLLIGGLIRMELFSRLLKVEPQR